MVGQPVDHHDILLKRMGSGPARISFFEKEHFFGGVRITRHVGHHKGGAHLPDFAIGFGHNPANSDALFHGFFGESIP